MSDQRINNLSEAQRKLFERLSHGKPDGEKEQTAHV